MSSAVFFVSCRDVPWRAYMPAVMDEYGVRRVLAVNECGCATFHLRDAGAPTIPPHIARRIIPLLFKKGCPKGGVVVKKSEKNPKNSLCTPSIVNFKNSIF